MSRTEEIKLTYLFIPPISPIDSSAFKMGGNRSLPPKSRKNDVSSGETQTSVNFIKYSYFSSQMGAISPRWGLYIPQIPCIMVNIDNEF
jgi:hypothetical protein